MPNHDPITTGRREAVTIAVVGELDVASEARVRAAVESALVRGGRAAHVRVDLDGLTFMDVAGVRVLASARRVADAAEARFELHACPARPAARLLRLTAMDHLLTVGEPCPGWVPDLVLRLVPASMEASPVA